jgi:hypothetical protein
MGMVVVWISVGVEIDELLEVRTSKRDSLSKPHADNQYILSTLLVEVCLSVVGRFVIAAIQIPFRRSIVSTSHSARRYLHSFPRSMMVVGCISAGLEIDELLKVRSSRELIFINRCRQSIHTIDLTS